MAQSPQGELPASHVILIVDDDDMVRPLLSRVLHEAGHCVVAASTAGAGLELLQHPERAGFPQIDLVVTNTMLPEMSGAELARRVQALRPGLPVLHVTGHPDAFPPGQSRRDTDRHLLRKPFAPNDLLRAVSELLDAT
jgi:CheY-like chemotaxis protein